MAILISGGAGFIGSHTCVELLNAGFEIAVLDNFCNSNAESCKRVEKITGKSFPVYTCDIRDKAGLDKVFAEVKPEAVIHFAGLKAVPESVKKPLLYYDNNIAGTVTLLQAMDDAGCKCIVFSSSATVYGDNNPVPFKEDMPEGKTTNPYGTTKLYIERILKDLCISDPEWHVCILRYFNPIGAHESGMIGEAPNGIPNNLMPYITQVAVGKREKLSIYGDDYNTPDGTGVRDYIHVTDLAIGHVRAVERALKTAGAEIFNLGTGHGVSVLELVKAFEKACGKPLPYVIAERRPGDIDTSYADASRANELLNWTAERGVDKMCEDSWRWQKNNPNGYDE